MQKFGTLRQPLLGFWTMWSRIKEKKNLPKKGVHLSCSAGGTHFARTNVRLICMPGQDVVNLPCSPGCDIVKPICTHNWGVLQLNCTADWNVVKLICTPAWLYCWLGCCKTNLYWLICCKTNPYSLLRYCKANLYSWLICFLQNQPILLTILLT